MKRLCLNIAFSVLFMLTGQSVASGGAMAQNPDPEGLTGMDEYHFSSEGYRTIGKRYGDYGADCSKYHTDSCGQK